MSHIFLKPGQYHIAKEPTIVETLVGSCVSVCLYNYKNGLAAINHFLQSRPARGVNSNIGMYGTTATQYIIDALMSLDPKPYHYRAQVFGGAKVLKVVGSTSDIGRDNINVALEVLSKAGIRVTGKKISGNRGRRIKFNTKTGIVQWRFAGDIPRKSKRSWN